MTEKEITKDAFTQVYEDIISALNEYDFVKVHSIGVNQSEETLEMIYKKLSFKDRILFSEILYR